MLYFITVIGESHTCCEAGSESCGSW